MAEVTSRREQLSTNPRHIWKHLANHYLSLGAGKHKLRNGGGEAISAVHAWSTSEGAGNHNLTESQLLCHLLMQVTLKSSGAVDIALYLYCNPSWLTAKNNGAAPGPSNAIFSAGETPPPLSPWGPRLPRPQSIRCAAPQHVHSSHRLTLYCFQPRTWLIFRIKKQQMRPFKSDCLRCLLPGDLQRRMCWRTSFSSTQPTISSGHPKPAIPLQTHTRTMCLRTTALWSATTRLLGCGAPFRKPDCMTCPFPPRNWYERAFLISQTCCEGIGDISSTQSDSP